MQGKCMVMLRGICAEGEYGASGTHSRSSSFIPTIIVITVVQYGFTTISYQRYSTRSGWYAYLRYDWIITSYRVMA